MFFKHGEIPCIKELKTGNIVYLYLFFIWEKFDLVLVVFAIFRAFNFTVCEKSGNKMILILVCYEGCF